MTSARHAMLAILFVTLLPRPAAAFENGSATVGQALAETWCAECHVIGSGDGQARAQSDAPPFAEIAKGADDARLPVLAAWLKTPHGAMPDLSLSRAEIADLLTYIESLVPAK